MVAISRPDGPAHRLIRSRRLPYYLCPVNAAGVFDSSFVSWLEQLRQEEMCSSLDGLPSLAQNDVSPRWHRGNLQFSRARFGDGGFCQRADALKNLSRIKTALAREPLPVLSIEVVAPVRSADFLYQVLGDVLPNFAAHNIVHRRQRCAIASNHDRVVLGMSVGIAG